MTDLILSTFTLFFVIVDPIGMGPIFIGLTHGHDEAARRRMAVRGIVIAALVLVIFALVGDAVLQALGIGLAAFRIAGGALLFLLAVDMVLARPSGLRAPTPSETEEAGTRDDISVFPLAVPLIAGPGAITAVLLTMGRTAHDPGQQALVLIIMVGVLGLTLVSLLLASRLTRLLGVTGTNVIGRVLGIVLAALACQYVLDGLADSGLF